MICNFCELKCDLSQASLCGMYQEKNSAIVESKPYCWSTIRTTLSESIPMFHCWPRRKLMEIGGFRCNADCSYCINARVMGMTQTEVSLTEISPQRIIEIAEKTGCSGLHFGINEVTVNLLSALEIAQLAHAKGFIVGASSNGYMTEYAAELMAKNFDYMNISLKSMSSDYYRRVVALPDVEIVKRNIKYLAKHLHLEVTTPIVQTENDHEILSAAHFLASVDSEMPWHIFRLLPEYKMADQTQPDVFELCQKTEQARSILPFTYFSNFIGSQMDNTLCPSCGELLIRRLCSKSCGDIMTEYRLKEDHTCPRCGRKIKMLGQPCLA